MVIGLTRSLERKVNNLIGQASSNSEALTHTPIVHSSKTTPANGNSHANPGLRVAFAAQKATGDRATLTLPEGDAEPLFALPYDPPRRHLNDTRVAADVDPELWARQDPHGHSR